MVGRRHGYTAPAVLCAFVAFSVSCSSGTVTDSSPVVVAPPLRASSGELFVSNVEGGSTRITVFPTGSTTPARQFPLGGRLIAADGIGNLYVTVGEGVAVIAPGASRVQRTIKQKGTVLALTCDRTNDLYVLTVDRHVSRIDEYFAGGSPLIRTITDKLNGATSIVADSILYAGNEADGLQDDGYVSVYAFGATTAERVIDGSSDPRALALDTSGYVYVADSHRNSVDAYAPGTTTPARHFTEGVDDPSVLAVDSANQILYVGVGNGGGGSTQQLLVFDVKSGKLDRKLDIAPKAIAVDASGNVYVLAAPHNKQSYVFMFPPGATGQGQILKTNVYDPRGIAIGG